MNNPYPPLMSSVHVPLNSNPEQTKRLETLQNAFAEACNALVPLALAHRCWNRVALHHMAYYALRQRFPQLGAQMVCNVIYSVSRTCRLLFQNPTSPWHLARLGERPLPRIEFAPDAPVYFDRHTLSVKRDGISMYTLDGRMHFDLALPPEVLQRFKTERLREIALSRQADRFVLSFVLGSDPTTSNSSPATELPQYLIVHDAALTPDETQGNGTAMTPLPTIKA